MTSSSGNIFRVTGHLCGEFTGPRWISRTKASDAELWCFFDLRLNKRLSKQPWGWWFETLSWWLWRHCNDLFQNMVVKWTIYAAAISSYHHQSSGILRLLLKRELHVTDLRFSTLKIERVKSTYIENGVQWYLVKRNTIWTVKYDSKKWGIYKPKDENMGKYINIKREKILHYVKLTSQLTFKSIFTESWLTYRRPVGNTLRPRQNGRRFADDTFKRIFF